MFDKMQNWADERLKSRGHLFLNEVYDMLGALTVVSIKNEEKDDENID